MFGWLILGSGGLFSALVFALLAAFFPGSAVAWVVTAPMLLITIAFTFLFVQSGKALGKSGEKKEETVRRKALDAIASQRNGIVSADDVAGMLRMDVATTDRWLTDLAKRDPDHVELEVDDNGKITYRFLAYAPDKWRMPVDAFAKTQVQNAMPAPQTAHTAPGAHARVAPLNVVDAEIVEDEPAAKRRSL